MRWMKRAFVILISAALLLSAEVPAKAAEYTYTVRIYAGVQGGIDTDDFVQISTQGSYRYEYGLDENGEYYEIRGLKYGDRVTLNRSKIVVPYDEDTGLPVKYNASGFRLSGRDNSEADTEAATPSFVVTGDMDYVVAYNILNNPVQYTVRYVDAAGNNLREPETFYGNVGERPVVAYRYIDNYLPQAYNITGTLKADSENVFTFEYTFIPEAGVITNYTVIELPGVVIDLGTTVIEGDGVPVPPAPPVVDIPDPDIPQGPGEDDAEDPDNPENRNDPEEIIDIDEGELPLSGRDGAGEDEEGLITIWNGNAFRLNIPVPVLVSLVVLLAALIALGVWGAVKYKRGKKS